MDDLIGLPTGWIWLLDPETRQFYSAAARNLPPYLQEPVRMAGSHCWCIEAFNNGELTPKNIDAMECSRLQPAVKRQAADLTRGLRYHASIPLYFQGKPLGIMNVTRPAWRELTRDELRLLSTIAYQVGIAIERARLAEEATRLARSEERARLAREIHDTLAQGLTAIALNLEGALPHLESDPARARERLERALTQSRESLDEARRSVMDLRTAPLAAKPLAEALAALGRAFTSDTGVRVNVHSRVERTLPLRIEAELFRIVQEALANVRRHARARTVGIDLRVDGRTARLTVRDDGRGFASASATRPPSEGHHGVAGMRERANLLGGRLRVESRPGRGTRLVTTVPIADEGDLRAPEP